MLVGVDEVKWFFVEQKSLVFVYFKLVEIVFVGVKVNVFFFFIEECDFYLV